MPPGHSQRGRLIVCDEAVGALLDLDADATHLFTFDLDPFTFLDG